ncbi:hypothetical protein LQZ18_06300, partial [Lachnospiraceae bacterium ZAX-1]
ELGILSAVPCRFLVFRPTALRLPLLDRGLFSGAHRWTPKSIWTFSVQPGCPARPCFLLNLSRLFHCSVVKVLCRLCFFYSGLPRQATTSIYYHVHLRLSTAFFNFFGNFCRLTVIKTKLDILHL